MGKSGGGRVGSASTREWKKRRLRWGGRGGKGADGDVGE